MDIRSQVEAILAGPRPIPILAAGHPALRQRATAYDGQLGDLLPVFLSAMRATMHAAPGVGLAAPQVGVGLAVAVAEDTAEVDEEVRRVRERPPTAYRVLINPAYEPIGETRTEFYEGCLSIPGWAAVRARHHRIRLNCEDADGRNIGEDLAGWPARIVQHETDHLAGELYLDRAELRSLSDVESMVRWWNGPSPDRAARQLGFSLGGGAPA
ncbi:MAG: peptide deformylase [Mycobacteriales bacterium]